MILKSTARLAIETMADYMDRHCECGEDGKCAIAAQMRALLEEMDELQRQRDELVSKLGDAEGQR